MVKYFTTPILVSSPFLAIWMLFSVISCGKDGISLRNRDENAHHDDEPTKVGDLTKTPSEDDDRRPPIEEFSHEESIDGKLGDGARLVSEILSFLPKEDDQLKIVCKRKSGDKVRKIFCSGQKPEIKSLKELQAALGFSFDEDGDMLRGRASGFAFTAGSSSIVAKQSSSINPRLIMFSAEDEIVSLGFIRGEQFVEVVAEDPISKNLRFFLISFTQDCNKKSEGCSYGDLLTEKVEKNWKSVTVYEDVDIENSIFDCKQCHQPQGKGQRKMLRMQELRRPWTHFLASNTRSGEDLIDDFNRAHSGQEFAGVPANKIKKSDPQNMERFIRRAGFGDQPNEFDSRDIERETRRGKTGGETWNALYDRFVVGEAIAPPYHQAKVTDPVKFQKAVNSYLAYRSGALSADKLPDIRNVLDNKGARDMGFMVKAGLDAQGILIQACKQCHNSALNQQISRAKFNVDLKLMSRAQKDKAIRRLKLGTNDPKKMPPTRFRRLTDHEITLLEQLLKQ